MRNSKVIDERIPLTIVNDIDGIARRENGENSGIIEASGVFWVVLYLQMGTENVSPQVRQNNQKRNSP